LVDHDIWGRRRDRIAYSPWIECVSDGGGGAKLAAVDPATGARRTGHLMTKRAQCTHEWKAYRTRRQQRIFS
jgi:hypothetical protein